MDPSEVANALMEFNEGMKATKAIKRRYEIEQEKEKEEQARG